MIGMERLLSVKDIADRYQVKPGTARKYMRNMVHLDCPLMVTERAVMDWERKHTLPPEDETRQIIKERGNRVDRRAVGRHETGGRRTGV